MPVPALIAAAPYVLSGLSALGGIFGKKKRKYIDEQSLRQMYGPKAVAQDTTELANYILNSPYGQQLMASAAEQGQGFATEMAARAAESGLSPDTGGQSSGSDFAVAAGSQAQSGLERQTRSGFYQSAMPIAAEMVSGRMQAALSQNQDMNANAPMNFMGRLGAAAGQVASTIPVGAGRAASTGLPTQALAAAANMPTELPQLRQIAPASMQMPAASQPVMQTALTNARSGGMRRGLTSRRSR